MKHRQKVPCTEELTFHECELAILRQAVDENEKVGKQQLANSDEVKRMIQIVEAFLRKTSCICYGGTAINNILPKEAQFYDREIEVPDYDFYSADPIKHCKELADIFFREGYADVEAKSGMHYGTFKVFVNFIPMADITEIHSDLYRSIQKEAIRIDGILYAPPNFLRMNMFLELSRPKGDVSRWEKVLKRLTILNEHYPLKNSTCQHVDFQRRMDKHKDKSEQLYVVIRDCFIHQKVVFFGGYASSIYSRYMPENQRHLVQSIPDFDVLSEDPDVCASVVIDTITQKYGKRFDITVTKHEAIGEIIPEHIELKFGNETLAFIYKPIACHNYNELRIHKQVIRIATIDCMLSFFLAFLYTDHEYYSRYKERLLCMSQFLFEVEQKNRLSQRGLLKRFTMTCYGTQPTIESIRALKAEKFKELRGDKTNAEYEKWFLKYNPTNDSVKQRRVTTTKKKKRTARRTRRSHSYLY
jgi:hypothetical protein